jgi:signal transduction histidine kinase
MERLLDRLKIGLACTWLLFTVALAWWWMVFGLRQIEQLRAAAVVNIPKTDEYHRMLLWEGAVLIVLLVGGGVALISYIWRERRRHRQIEEFFAAFTHDAKTALASLQLQAESIGEDLAGKTPNPLIERLLKDALRLQLQLENSLFLVNLRRGSLLRERVGIQRVIESMRFHWPEVGLRLTGDGIVVADLRALESVFTNLVQNAVIHGRATEVSITVTGQGTPRIQITVEDDGAGFTGDFRQLGKLFTRHTRSSGSGVGLYITRQLLQRMGGAIRFAPSRLGGLAVSLVLPAAGRGEEVEVLPAGGGQRELRGRAAR